MIRQFFQQSTDTQLAQFAAQWREQLQGEVGLLPESRARALLLVTKSADETLLQDFARLLQDKSAERLALHDLLEAQGGVVPPINLIGQREPLTAMGWLTLAMAVYATKVDYPLDNLDPTVPPTPFSPAGQIIHQAGQWLKKQLQRTPLDRKKGRKQLAFVGKDAATTTGPSTTLPPTRSEIPVRHFEFNPPLAIDSNDQPQPMPPIIPLRDPVIITEEEVRNWKDQIKIVGDSRVIPRPNRPNPAATEPTTPLTQQLRDMAESARDTANQWVSRAQSVAAQRAANAQSAATPSLQYTRLKVTVQEHPQGRGLPGIQVSATYKGSKREIAGTTNQDGEFWLKLPIPAERTMTYQLLVHWPQQFGGKVEKKAVTVSAERDLYELPFYHRL